MRSQRNRPRPYGTGSLLDRNGRWYGQWRAGGHQVKRAIGPKRRSSCPEGLTQKQAEARLRELISETRPIAPHESLTVEEAGKRHIHNLEHILGRKPTTISDYRSILVVHLAPHFGAKRLDRITADDVGSYVSLKLQTLAPKTVSNHVLFVQGIFAFAIKRGWTRQNPAGDVDRPRSVAANDHEVRHFKPSELEALLAAVPDDQLGPTDRVLYLTAAMTGLRQGELAALRWRDVDHTAGAIRVRRNFTRGAFSTPKSRNSSRAVPMANHVAVALRAHHEESRHQADDDLVFGHPATGNPYDASNMRKRFKCARAAVGLRPLRFHDLRHTYGTAMASAGAPLRAVQEWMGHSDYRTTAIYADYAPDPSNAASWAEAAFQGNPRPVHQVSPAS